MYGLDSLSEQKSEESMEKSADISEKIRNGGNKLFGEKNHNNDLHRSILWKYSQSVAYAPAKSEHLAKAYSNRSLLLMHLGRYQEAIADMDRALQTTKSKDLLQKIQARKAELLNSKKFLNKQKEDVSLSLPNIATPSTIVPCASDSVLLECNETFGRHYVAARDIKPGEIIIAEEGYICVTRNNLRYFVCSHCLQFTWNGIPCNSCPFALYCSENCKEEAWEEYHDLECKVYPSLTLFESEVNGNMISDMPITVKIFLKAVKKEGLNAVLKQAEVISKDNELTGLFSEGILKSDKFKTIYNLQSEIQCGVQMLQNDDVTNLIKLLSVKSTILDSVKNSENKVPDMVITQLKKLLNKIRYIVSKNALLYQGNICEFQHSKETQCISGSNQGIIIAPSSSLLNHSCCSNVSRTFHPKKKVVFFTLVPVTKGEQLTISYGESYKIEKNTRKEQLLQKCNFSCSCKACSEDWPSENKIQESIHSQTINNVLNKVTYDFQKIYPEESSSNLSECPYNTWGSNEIALKKSCLKCDLTFKHFGNLYKEAFYMSAPEQYSIKRIMIDMYADKCTIISDCKKKASIKAENRDTSI